MTIIVDASQGSVSPAPSTLFSAREIGELALGRIGAFTPNDTQADERELDIAIHWMEIEIAELAGTERCQWLIPESVSVVLEPGVAEIEDLLDELGDAAPSTQIASVVSAAIVDSAGNETQLTMVRRRKYEEIEDKTTSGEPEWIHIDRNNDAPRAFLYPVPADLGDGTTGLTLKLNVQTYAPSVMGAETPATAGDLRHGLDRAWQKWLVNQVAAVIGDGPVRQLPDQKVGRLQTLAAASRAALLAYQNREKVSPGQRRTRRYGG